MRHKVRLDTMRDIQRFVDTVSGIDAKVTLEDGTGICVNAKSLLGAIYTTEWTHVYCYCDKDISGKIIEWII